ncbi:MAG TPA: Tad domain-containing protein [Bdellovibrionota bacterium]|nr:Tad domain-containing protein [Bdellovibrionota bacterium]
MKKRSHILTSEKGQVAVLVAVIFTFLFLLFGMVINIGMLIHHKINLQNAADMAAYSGAAEQARILSTIGWKNFELRKNLKEFAYFYWAQHSAWNDGFPRKQWQATGLQRPDWMPIICLDDHFNNWAQSEDPSFTPNRRIAEICKWTQVSFPQIIRPDFIWGRLGTILNTELNYLQDVNKTRCGEYDKYNEAHAMEDRNRYKGFADTLLTQIEDLSRAINKEEEDSLNNTLNHSEFTSSIPRKWNQNSFDKGGTRVFGIQPLPKDIGTLAYQTAWKNLSEPNKIGFQFVPIKPKGPYLRLESFKHNYVLNYMKFPWSTSRNTCSPEPYGLDIRDFPVAVRKDKKNVTYYSIRLASRPWLPFLPGLSQPTLEAYAAAKPFGGRIGPEQEDPLIMDRHPPGHFGIPNISLGPAYPQGLRHREVLYKLSHWPYGADRSSADAVVMTKQYGRAALRAANIYEADKYTFNLNNDVPDPRLTDHPDLLPAPSKANYPFVVTNPQTLNSGWNGRAGYSVKFVSFQELLGYDNPPSDIPQRDLDLAH